MDNSYEQQAIDLVNERGSLMIENSELKAQVNSLLKACKLYGDCFVCSNAESDEADTIVLLTPEQCLNSVKIAAVDFAAIQINGQCDGELCQEILANYIEELRSNN